MNYVDVLVDGQYVDELHNPTLKWKTIWEIGVPYFISFSAAKDNLPMWNMYGNKGHGVAIGFNEDAIRDCCNNNIGDVHHRAKMAMRSRKLYECKYWNKIEIKEFIHQITGRFSDPHSHQSRPRQWGM